MIIREAGREDGPAILELVGHFIGQSAYGTLFTYPPAQLGALFDAALRLGVVFVADVDGVIVGLLAAVALESPYTGEAYADELAWWVEPAYRRGLVGPKLLGALKRWARQKGLTSIKMLAPAHSDVGRFYRRLGYVEVETAYVLRLT